MPADSTLALRVLFKERSFALLAALVLALGIGGVATQASIISGMMLRGLSFPNGPQLMTLNLVDPSQPQGQGNFGGGAPSADYLVMREAQRSFSELAAYLGGSTVNVSFRGQPQRYTGGYVTANFLRTLGVRPLHGRDFTEADNQPGAEKTVILGHLIWQRDFEGDPNVVGQQVRVNGKSAVVIGVMGPGFSFPANEQLWVPLFNEFPARERSDPLSIAPAMLGAIKPGVSIDQAAAEFATLAQRLAKDFPATNKNFTAMQVQPFVQSFFGPQFRQIMFVMLGAVLIVLLIACVNVMNMQFARATRRAKEMAIRGALGASRARLIRQMLVESFVLAGLGAIGGTLLAFWATDYLFRFSRNLPFPLPSWVSFDLDWRALVATLGAAALAALASGFLPAWLGSRSRTSDMLKEGGRGSTNRIVALITRSLVIGQIAATAALLIVSSFMVRSIINQQNVNWGYDTQGVFTARMGLFQADYPTPQAKQQFYDRTLRELRANPLFTDAALSSRLWLNFFGPGAYEVEGEVYKDEKSRPVAFQESVSPGYFATLGGELREGRDFTDADTEEHQPTAIVNPAFVRKHFQGQSPLGRRVRLVFPDNTTGAWRTIVGVSPAFRMQGPFNPPGQPRDGAGFYLPMNNQTPQFATVIVRGRGAATSLAEPLRKAMAGLDSNLPLYFTGTPGTLIDGTLGQNRVLATMFSIFGGVAVVLAAVGLYGVMSYAVNQQTQEFGIRMALGASTSRILRMILEQGATQLLLGLALGLTAAAGLVTMGSALMANILFEVRPFDPTIWISTVVLLSAVTLAACFAPARRAARVHPMVALRYE